MSKIIERTYKVKVLVCDCGREHIIEQSEDTKPSITSVVRTATIKPKTKVVKKLKGFASYPGIDIEAFINDAKRTMDNSYVKSTKHDETIRNTALALKYGTTYLKKGGSESEMRKMSKIAKAMRYTRRKQKKKVAQL